MGRVDRRHLERTVCLLPSAVGYSSHRFVPRCRAVGYWLDEDGCSGIHPSVAIERGAVRVNLAHAVTTDASVEQVSDCWAELGRSPEHQKPTIERT